MTRTTRRRRENFPRIRYGEQFPGGLTIVHLAIPMTEEEIAAMRDASERSGERVADVAAAALLDCLRVEIRRRAKAREVPRA